MKQLLLLATLTSLLLISCGGGVDSRPEARNEDQGVMRGSVWSRGNAAILSGKETRIDLGEREAWELNNKINTAKWITLAQAFELARQSQLLETMKNSAAYRWADQFDSFQAEGNWLEAARAASAAIARVPTLAVAFVFRAMAYTELGLTEKAMNDCRTALEYEPDMIYAYNVMGVAYQRHKDLPRAIYYFRTACDYGNDSACRNLEQIDDKNQTHPVGWARTLQNESIAAFKSGNYKEVEGTTTKLLELEPENVFAYITRSGARTLLQKYSPAIDDAHRALNLDPDNGIAYNNLGFVHEQMEDIIRAEFFYKKACNLGVTLGCNNLKMIQDRPSLR